MAEISFEIQINIDTMQIISANSNFYRFSDSRRYQNFDKMIEPQDAIIIRAYAKANCLNRDFIVHLYDEMEEDVMEMAVYISEVDGNRVSLHMRQTQGLLTTISSMEKLARDYAILLNQYFRRYYEYNKKTGWVEIFSFHPERRVEKVVSFESLKKCLHDKNGDSDIVVNKIIADIENGTREFSHAVNGKKLVMFEDEGEVVLCGNAIFENGIHVKTIGNIGPTGCEKKYISNKRDQLTGLLLKDDITQMARLAVEELKQEVTIAIIDIDDFKRVNDNFGHMKGDEVLRQCGEIILNAVRKYGKAGRIGGDEFFIVLDYLEDPNEVRTILREIKNNIAALYSIKKDGFQVTTSIGCATYPGDMDNFNDLFFLADYLLYLAKEKGKNRYILYSADKHGKAEEILKQGIEKLGVSSRKGMSKAEVICKIEDRLIDDNHYPIDKILDDIVDYFGVERIIIYDKDELKVLYQCGNDLLSNEILENTCNYIVDGELEKLYDNGVLVINNIEMSKDFSKELLDKLRTQGVLSFMHHNVTGLNNKKYVISYESVRLRNTWNTEDMYYFRILDRIFARCL